MKQIEMEITKRNRKYFACLLPNGYQAKILIDENSNDLDIGKHDLLLDDISKRSKFGTELIYRLTTPANEQKESQGKIVLLDHPVFNADLVTECKSLGGRWDSENKVWAFSAIVEDKVEELDEIYNSNLIPVEITALKNIEWRHDTVDFLGYTIAKAFGRDSGAKLGDGVSLIEGIATSGGSRANWTTLVKTGAVFRLYVPTNLLDREINNYVDQWSIKRLEDGHA